MSNLTVTNAIENALIKGDLKDLTSEQRLSYVKTVCETVGLNYLTKPFEYIQLNGKLTLYATRAATDQLRSVHKVSIKITDRQKFDDIYVVTAQATNADGRFDESTGAVNVAGLKGDALANAYLKAETKAKRRVTLSLCGLGLLDESEVASIPEAKHVQEPEEKKPLVEKIADIKESRIESETLESLGSYVVKVGKKYAGKKIKDIDPVDLESYLFDYIEQGSKKQNKPIEGDWLELFNTGKQYLKKFGEDNLVL